MSARAHIERQNRMDREARGEWKKWMANMTEEEKAKLEGMGITGYDSDIQRGPIIRDEIEHDPFATIPAPESDRYFDEPENDDDDEDLERRAFHLAGDLVREALELMTRSNLPGLARAAETLILATKQRSSLDHQIQAELARKYNVTRAAINKDVSYIREHRTFGKLAAYMFTDPGVREECGLRTSKAHKENKRLCKTPPPNSITGMVQELLKSA